MAGVKKWEWRWSCLVVREEGWITQDLVRSEFGLCFEFSGGF